MSWPPMRIVSLIVLVLAGAFLLVFDPAVGSVVPGAAYILAALLLLWAGVMLVRAFHSSGWLPAGLGILAVLLALHPLHREEAYFPTMPFVLMLLSSMTGVILGFRALRRADTGLPLASLGFLLSLFALGYGAYLFGVMQSYMFMLTG